MANVASEASGSGVPWRFRDVRATSDGTGWSGTWACPDNLAYVDGHFPEMPLLPAAVIMEVALAFVRDASGAPQLAIASARHCKFKAPVRPGEAFVLRAEGKPGARWDVTWTPVGKADPVVELEFRAVPEAP